MKELKRIILVICAMWIVQSAIVTIDPSNNTLSQVCSQSPFWSLNLCNLTCSTCQAGQSNKCSSCYGAYVLNSQSSTCTLSNNTFTFYYQQFLTKNALAAADVKLFSSEFRYSQLQASDIVYLCRNNSYKFSMVGLFDSQEIITISRKFDYVISQIQIRMNYLTVVNNNQLTINLITSSKIIPIVTQYNTISDLNGQYLQSTDSATFSFLNLPALDVTNVREILQIVMISATIMDSQFTISIESKAKINTKFWAFSDVIILARQCDTCVSKQLMARINEIGLITLYVFAALIVLLIMFFILLQISACLRNRKKNKKNDEISANNNNFPAKAIKRVLDSMDLGAVKNKFAEQKQLLYLTRQYAPVRQQKQK